MSCCYRVLQYLVSFFHIGILGLVVAAGVTDTWWKARWGISPAEGLWQLPNSNEKRPDLFEFTYINKHFDIVLISLCACAGCSLISLILSIVSSCQKYPSKCIILIEAITTLFATLSVGFGVLWALLKISLDNTGYAFYLAYGSVGLSIITLCLLITLLCMQSPSPYRSTNRDDEIAMLHR